MDERPDYHYRCVCGEPMHYERIYAGRPVICPRCAAPVITPKAAGDAAVRIDGDREYLTERLVLRMAKPDDWKVLLPISADPLNYAFELAEPTDKRELIKGLKQVRFPKGFSKHLSTCFLVTLREKAETIGYLNLTMEPGFLSGYIGLMIHHPHHGKGYGTEAVRELIWIAFKVLGLHRLYSSCDSENAACRKMFEKLGFASEGIMRDAAYHPSRGWVDIAHCGLINPDD